MTTPKSRLAYQAHFDVLDQAMNDPKGIRIRADDNGKAWRMRLEFHHARDLDRKDNAQTYEPGHMLYGCSVYDQLLLTIEQDDDQTWLYIRKRDARSFSIESLSEAHPVEEPVEEPEVEERRL